MDLAKIINELRIERQRIDEAIVAFERMAVIQKRPRSSLKGLFKYTHTKKVTNQRKTIRKKS